jgi:hypothetical protein
VEAGYNNKSYYQIDGYHDEYSLTAGFFSFAAI